MIPILYYLLQGQKEHRLGDFAEKMGYILGSFLYYAIPIALIILLLLFVVKKFRKRRKTYE